MTTFFDFVPSNVAPFTFSPTLDGATYNVAVLWNVFGRRYYVACYDLGGNLIFTVPLIGSPGGIVLQSISWAGGVATATAFDPHGYAPGETIRLSISGASPDAYNGTVDALVVDADSFTYPIAADPGPLVAAGSASRNINLAGAWFSSSLVYRAPSRQFEVSP